MRKLLDLTGRRFGRLVVINREPNDPYGRLGNMWLCKCDCGQTEVIGDYRLPRSEAQRCQQPMTVTACAECLSRRICLVCNKQFVTAAANACCSPACKSKHRQQIVRRSRETIAQRESGAQASERAS